jgi:hypothetical protein
MSEWIPSREPRTEASKESSQHSHSYMNFRDPCQYNRASANIDSGSQEKAIEKEERKSYVSAKAGLKPVSRIRMRGRFCSNKREG